MQLQIQTAARNLELRMEVVINNEGAIVGDIEKAVGRGWFATLHSQGSEDTQSFWGKKKDAIRWILQESRNYVAQV